jgi:hypothetical protein
MILFVLSGSVAATKCESPNTILTQSQSCVCRSGFPFGSPNTSEGCFKCEVPCHQLANCIFPGKCECNASYLGDGITS